MVCECGVFEWVAAGRVDSSVAEEATVCCAFRCAEVLDFVEYADARQSSNAIWLCTRLSVLCVAGGERTDLYAGLYLGPRGRGVLDDVEFARTRQCISELSIVLVEARTFRSWGRTRC